MSQNIHKIIVKKNQSIEVKSSKKTQYQLINDNGVGYSADEIEGHRVGADLELINKKTQSKVLLKDFYNADQESVVIFDSANSATGYVALDAGSTLSNVVGSTLGSQSVLMPVEVASTTGTSSWLGGNAGWLLSGLAGAGILAAALNENNDTTVAPTVTQPTASLTSDTGTSAKDSITNNAQLTVSSLGAGITRTYTINGATPSATYTAPTTDGAYSVVITDTDSKGNALSTTVVFTLDKTIAAPTIALTADTGTSTTDGITNNAALTISAAAADVTRSYSINGAAATSSYTAPTTDGTYTVVVTDTDTAGNVATASTTFTLDKTIDQPMLKLINDTGASKTDNITQDATLEFSPVAADVTRTYSVDGGAPTLLFTGIPPRDQILPGYPSGATKHTVVVTDTDKAGNVASNSIAFTLDKAAETPNLRLLVDSGGSKLDRVTNNAQLVTYIITADDPPPLTGNETLPTNWMSIEVPSDVTRTYSINGAATTSTYTAPTTDGTYTVVVTDTDTAGNVAMASTTFTLDKTIATPTVALTADTGTSTTDSITNDAALTISAAAADVTRSYSINGAAATSTYTAPTTDGTYTVVVTDIDTAGNVATASTTFTLDKTIATPTITLPNDTGVSNTDKITQDTSLTFSVAADVTRTYSVDGGTATTAYTAPTVDGAHTVVVTDADKAGNVTNSSMTFTLDTTIAKPEMSLVKDTGVSDSDLMTNIPDVRISPVGKDVIRTYVIKGSGFYGDAGSFYDAKFTTSATEVLNFEGLGLSEDIAQNVLTTSILNLPGFDDGKYAVTIEDTDLAGNTATNTLTFNVDQQIFIPLLQLVQDSGESNQDKITNDASLQSFIFDPRGPAIKYFGILANVIRTYSVDGGEATTTYTVPTVDGSHTVVVTDTDKAGNVASSTITFTLDKTIATPAIGLIMDAGSSATDLLTNDARLNVSAAAADVTRTYTIDGGAATSTYTAPTTDGSHTVVVNDIDAAGNASFDNITFTLDTVLTTPTVALTTDSGNSATDTVTNDATLAFNTSDSDATRTYSINGGAPTTSYTTPTVDGVYTVVVTDTDNAGNVATATAPFTLDRTIATPSIALTTDAGSSATDLLTNDASLTISPAASDVTRTYVVDGGAATATYTAPTADGSHTVVVNDVDVAGNTASASLTFTLDKTPPVDTLTMSLNDDSGSSATDNITMYGGFTLTGTTGTLNATNAYVSIDGATPILISNYNDSMLADGSHTLVGSEIDAAGNSVSSAPLTFIFDTHIDTPTVSFNPISSSTADLIATFPTLIENTPAETLTREYIITTDTGAAFSTGTTFVAPTTQGFYTLTMQDTDVAGNIATSTPIDFAIGSANTNGTLTALPSVNNVFIGGSGNDILYGKGGVDQFYCGSGNDAVVINLENLNHIVDGSSAVYGGTGWDSLSLEESATFSLSSLIGHVHSIEGISAQESAAVMVKDVTSANVAALSEIGALSSMGWTGAAMDASRHQMAFYHSGSSSSLNFSIPTNNWVAMGTVTDEVGSTWNVYNSVDGSSQFFY